MNVREEIILHLEKLSGMVTMICGLTAKSFAFHLGQNILDLGRVNTTET